MAGEGWPKNMSRARQSAQSLDSMTVTFSRMGGRCTVASALMLVPASVHAQYLDPGAGSILTQVVVALVVGASAIVKLYWTRISTFVWRRKKHDIGR